MGMKKVRVYRFTCDYKGCDCTVDHTTVVKNQLPPGWVGHGGLYLCPPHGTECDSAMNAANEWTGSICDCKEYMDFLARSGIQ